MTADPQEFYEPEPEGGYDDDVEFIETEPDLTFEPEDYDVLTCTECQLQYIVDEPRGMRQGVDEADGFRCFWCINILRARLFEVMAEAWRRRAGGC